jgi:hypothetical protein
MAVDCRMKKKERKKTLKLGGFDTNLTVNSMAREQLLQLTALEIGLENEIEDPTPFPLSIKEDCLYNDIGNSSKALPPAT